jgi:hypothetical protein
MSIDPKPKEVHLKVYGCKAFALTDDTHRGKFKLMRLDACAWIGYLVGYRSTNIFRIRIPALDKVITTRDVVFNENKVLDDKEQTLIDSLMHTTSSDIAKLVTNLEIPEVGPNHHRVIFEDEEPSTSSSVGAEPMGNRTRQALPEATTTCNRTYQTPAPLNSVQHVTDAAPNWSERQIPRQIRIARMLH